LVHGDLSIFQLTQANHAEMVRRLRPAGWKSRCAPMRQPRLPKRDWGRTIVAIVPESGPALRRSGAAAKRCLFKVGVH
jgi:hypothetical protein